nr:hypothetical protein [Tanacetum cinerariifolium]
MFWILNDVGPSPVPFDERRFRIKIASTCSWCAEVLMMDSLSIVEADKVIHAVETDIVKLVVEIKSFGMSSDDFDNETRLSDGLQLKQADMSCVHALSELYLHEIHVFLNNHEADQY